MRIDDIPQKRTRGYIRSESPIGTEGISEEETNDTRSEEYEVVETKKRKKRAVHKEDKEAKKAQREILMKEKLEELDRLERSVKDGTHNEYHKIKDRQEKRLYVAKMRRSLAERTVHSLFQSQKDSAYSQYHWNKLALRRSMIENIQKKLNSLEKEYYTNHSTSDDDDHLSDWVPPERPLAISSLTLGLTTEETENDLLLAVK